MPSKRIQFHESFTKKKAQKNANAESDQDRTGRILANVNLAFSLPTLRRRFCILRSASKLFSLGFARQQLGAATSALLEKNLSIPPTVKIRQGYGSNIVVVKDLFSTGLTWSPTIKRQKEKGNISRSSSAFCSAA
jgi:type IV secretory pathway VirB10-like protein